MGHKMGPMMLMYDVALQELLLDELVARSATGMLQEGRKTLLYKDVGEFFSLVLAC